MVLIPPNVSEYLDDPVTLELGTAGSIAQRCRSLRAVGEEPEVG